MLKIIVSFQRLVANKMFATNKVDSIKSGELTRKFTKSKIENC